MAQATDTTGMRLTAGQKTWLAVQIAKAHELPIATGLDLADTIAGLLPSLPTDQTRRCVCGAAIGPTQQWCSQRCFGDDEGRDHERELADVR